MVDFSDSLNVGPGPTNPFVTFSKSETEQSLPDRFEQQVKLHPDRIAIKFKGHSVSYRQLNDRANRVGWALLQAHGQREEQVALLVENGESLISAILGVLKAGKVYVPLDPSLPQTRTQFILQDSLATVILTNNKNLSLGTRLADGEVQLINIDDFDLNFRIENIGLAISPDALAYLIYTSGSTGKPKGVIETHRNLLHNVMRNTNVLHVSTNDRISLLRSIGAGGAARDALTALLNGAALCPFSVNDDGLGNLGRWLIDDEITIFTSVISVFRHFVAALSGTERFENVRLIYAGGEQVTRADVELYQRYFPDDCLFVNRLGVTETGTVAYYFVDKKMKLEAGTVPVGYAAEDTEILLLDESGHEVGPDCIGEIAVRSRYISPGYWRSPELTQSNFLPDPTGGDKRIYLTGDLGLKRPDCCLFHLGRKDFQVNIRGYRVEVSEIEAELRNHAAVKEIAVVGTEHPSGEVRLVAAIVPRESVSLSSGNLREFLKDRLPEHMIPSAFVFLDVLPRGPNGKVNRHALTMPDWMPSQRSSKYAAPRTELEELIVGLWEDSLGLETVGIHDDFFDLGGHSLLLGQIVSKLQTTFRIEIRLEDFLRNPTVAVLAQVIGTNFQTQHGLMTPIAAASREDPIPLSFAQERLWFLDQLEPGSAAYNIPTATLIEGNLDVVAMEKALNEVIKRHEALRTTVTVAKGQPAQVICPELWLTLPVVDLSVFTEYESEAEARRLIAEYAQQPFDLSGGPLLRVYLLKLNHNKHIFVTIHHLIADAWSIGILFNELSAFYDLYSGGQSSPPPKLPVQYADFAVWQREILQDDILDYQISYWKKQLKNYLAVVEIPIDRPRPAQQSFRGARQSIVFPENLTAAIKQLSRRESVTLFTTLLAAFKTLLYRYSGQEEVVIGSPIAGRNRTEIENLIGLFANTLVLRTDLSENPSFRDLLKRVREASFGAYAHQDLPFEKLVEELQPERDLSRNPLFQVMFVLQNAPNSVLNFTRLTSRRLEIDSGTSKFDLTLSLAEQDRKLVGSFEYSTDLFDHPTIERMIGHFQSLLEGIVGDPDQRISDLPILTEAERRRLLFEWNNTEADYPKDKCIHELFEEQVKQTPDAIAVTFEGQRLTYRELNTKANQLAHHLRRLGVGPGRIVGICLERSLEMVIGLLGILKAGGAYVPLDPSYPRERLAFMLEDAEISVLLTQERLIEYEKWQVQDGDLRSSTLHSQMKTACLDRDWHLIETQSRDTPGKEVSSDDLAYIIYTSGSLGKPKGVQVSHRSVVNCLHSISQRVGFTSQDVLLAVTTISFDIAGLELYLPLMVGGQVAVASREDAVDGERLLKRLTEDSVTAMQATPSTWRLLLDAGWLGAEKFKILCGGDVLSRDLAEGLREHGRLWNLYGPTETTIWSAICAVESGERSIPIGRPIANTKIYLLDSHLQPVPIGVRGELYISGDGLARGYLSQPELMAEKFVADPFSDKPGSRLYKTGDVARYLVDGNIEFLARIDNQVKIRGHRIDLGEIETILNRHPAVKESVIVARDRDSSGEKELVGYVSAQETALSLSELRRFVHEKLPDYMIPTLFVFLETFPLTPNGKVDRNALPPPNGERPQLDQGFVEPRTEIEELIAQVWREILKLDKIGIHDNFFELGGHSLLATRVVARLRGSFHVDIALRKLFELPTVAGLAQHIDLLRHSEFGTSIAPIVPVDRAQPLPLSFSQRRLWYLQKVDTNLSSYNIPAVFRVKGDLNSTALEQALNEMVARHDVLRSYVKEVDGQPRQEILPSLRIALPAIDLTHLPDEQAEIEAKRLYSADARQLYDLANAPLMRATLVKLAQDNHVFILNFHHIIADGSSLAIFYKEFATHYDAARNNKAAPFPRLAAQYADYAAWQQEWLNSSSFDMQLSYWRRQLASLPEPCALPTDFDRPMLPTHRGARLTMQLSSELTWALKNLSRQQSVTMFMTLFATFSVLMSRISGQEDIVLGSTIAGRNHPETDGLIGFFINALPLRCNLSGEPSFATLLQRVRELCLDAYTNQDVPFDKIVEEIKPRREPGRNPIFDILFNVADISERVFALAECEVTKLSPSEPAAKFDIVLYAPEVDGKIELAIVYNTTLFREGRIKLLLEQFASLLAQIVDKPELPVDQLSLGTDTSRTVLPDPKEALDDNWEGAIHELLAGQARRSPAKLAIVDPEQTWTYADLDRCANRLGNGLIASAIESKDLIAIYAHRSSSLIVALFGILKAGASFLILDPAYPAARTIDYLRIAQPKGWLQLEGSGELPDELSSCLDSLQMRCRMNVPQSKAEIFDNLSAYADTEPATIVTADTPAYVAFTSGSTGEPKGVVCRHGPVTHFLPWQKGKFGLNETDRFAMLSGLAYSHLHRDVFTAMSLGATLYVPNPSEVRSPERLAQWLERNAITVLHLTPALGQLLLTNGDARLPSVRRVFFGGDVLTSEMVASIRRFAPNATIGSFYGATETQRAVGYYGIPDESVLNDRPTNKPVPLGRGIKDVQLLVLNKSGHLAGIGELGELFVRSPHLAAGYIGDDERTRRMFVINPFTNNPADRLYRTGELARYLADGNVEWAGRNDRRVNIRGFRVELEEIETVLKQHPTVKNAAVVMREVELPDSETSNSEGSDNPKSKIENPKLDVRLVAYIAADEEPQSIEDLLHSYLSSRLPDYMGPARFVISNSLPLNPNGKVDYRALPPVRFSADAAAAAPRNDIEVKLQAIFAEVLGRSDIGIDDNFFRIGGHSLLAARAAARVGDAFGVNLTLSIFLETPTIMRLATKVASLFSAGQTSAESDKDQREEFNL